MTLIRTYLVRFDVDYPLHLLRCLPANEDSINPQYASLRFEDGIQLARLIQSAGLSEEIVNGASRSRAWIVTFQQLLVLGFSEQELRQIGIFPSSDLA